MKPRRVVLVGVFAIAFSALLAGCDSPHLPASLPVSTTPSAASQSTPPKPVENWAYTEDNDEMSGKKMSWACTTAPEGVDLCLRKKGGKLESFINFNSVTDGQFLCLEDACSTKARFDDGPVISFGGVEADGGKTTMLFLEPTPRLISQLRKAKTLKLQPPIYENSGEVLHFDVSGLKW
jgi:hypothetical protein